MNILIVDDEILSVESIACHIDWSQLGIDNIYQAYSKKMAQKIFLEHTVDILLCDIEMPKGNGIELMEWVRSQNYNTVGIFLTSFSKFEHASNAVKLQMLDYVLKPCDFDQLTQILAKAVKVAQEKQSYKQLAIQSYHDQVDQNRLTDAFLQEYLQGTISAHPYSLKHEVLMRHLDETILDASYHLFMLQMVPSISADEHDDYAQRYALRNIISESIHCNHVLLWDNVYLSIIPENSFTNFDMLTSTARQLANSLEKITNHTFIGHLGESCSFNMLCDLYQEIRNQSLSRYALNTRIFIWSEKYVPATIPSSLHDFIYQKLLVADATSIYCKLQELYSSTDSHTYISRAMLYELSNILQSSVTNILAQYHISLNPWIQEKLGQLYLEAFWSIPHFDRWAHHLVESTLTALPILDTNQILINTLTEYIRTHLNEDLTRAELSQIAHIHPDYLSKLFHQKMKVGLNEYISIMRISEAKNLLRTSNKSISDIATSVGFQTIPYFSKQFKKLVGMTPIEYRSLRT